MSPSGRDGHPPGGRLPGATSVPERLEQLEVVLRHESVQIGRIRRPGRRLVRPRAALDEERLEAGPGEHEEDASRLLAHHRVRVRDVLRRVDEVAGRGGQRAPAAGQLDLAVDDVERFRLAVMDVERRRGPGRLERLDDAEGAVGRGGGREDADLAGRAPADRRALACADDGCFGGACVHVSSFASVGGGPTRTTPCRRSTASSRSSGTRGPSAGGWSQGHAAGSDNARTYSSIPAGVDRKSIRAVSDSTRKACGTPPGTNTAVPGSHACRSASSQTTTFPSR